MNNYIVVIRFFENNTFVEIKTKGYGPYSKDEAERITFQLQLTETRRRLRKGVSPTFLTEASTLMLEPKGVEEILAFIKSEEEKQMHGHQNPSETC